MNIEGAIDPNLQSIVDDVERLTNLIVRASATKDYAIGADLDALREDIYAAISNIKGICDELCLNARHGAQRGPSSVGRIEAERKQVEQQLRDDTTTRQSKEGNGQ